jgi:hypothetical protein
VRPHSRQREEAHQPPAESEVYFRIGIYALAIIVRFFLAKNTFVPAPFFFICFRTNFSEKEVEWKAPEDFSFTVQERLIGSYPMHVSKEVHTLVLSPYEAVGYLGE